MECISWQSKFHCTHSNSLHMYRSTDHLAYLIFSIFVCAHYALHRWVCTKMISRYVLCVYWSLLQFEIRVLKLFQGLHSRWMYSHGNSLNHDELVRLRLLYGGEHSRPSVLRYLHCRPHAHRIRRVNQSGEIIDRVNQSGEIIHIVNNRPLTYMGLNLKRLN